jgi:hypothetical protein
MKVQLVKGETKETFGEGENSFDYWHRPLTVEEKTNIKSHVVWKDIRKGSSVDFKQTDMLELVRLSVTRIDRLYDSDDGKIDTIEKLLDSSIESGFLDGVILSMWVTIWVNMSLSEELKKKLSQDSTPTATG